MGSANHRNYADTDMRDLATKARRNPVDSLTSRRHEQPHRTVTEGVAE
jgi:hypothetical protein